MSDFRVPAHFYVGLTGEGKQSPTSRGLAPVWPMPEQEGQPGPWLPRVAGRLPVDGTDSYLVFEGGDLDELLDAGALWEVEPDWLSLAKSWTGWRTRTARLLRRVPAFHDAWKRSFSRARAQHAMEVVTERFPGLSGELVLRTRAVLEPTADSDGSARAARNLDAQVNAAAEMWVEGGVIPTGEAALYAVARSAAATADSSRFMEAVEWAGHAHTIALKRSANFETDWLVEPAGWPWLSRKAAYKAGLKPATRWRESAANELGLDTTSDRPISPPIRGPERQKLDPERVPQVDELLAAAERSVVSGSVARWDDLCLGIFTWLDGADGERMGRDLEDISAGLAATAHAVDSAELVEVVREVLEDATDAGTFELAAEGRWRTPDPSVRQAWRLNPANILRGAAVDGWDLMILGTGYDWPSTKIPEEIVIVGGPAGPLPEAVHVLLTGDPGAGGGGDFTSFAFLADLREPAYEGLLEIAFDAQPTCYPYCSGFSLMEVYPEKVSLGAPVDLRERTEGWATWLGTELVVAWARRGDEALDATKETYEPTDEESDSPRFWLVLAREIARRT